MFRVTTNRTEQSWARTDIKNAKPSEDSNEILERITKIMPEGMSFDAAVDFCKMQLGTWRRFYKENDKVDVDEAFTAENKKVTQIRSLSIVFYVREIDDRNIKISSGFYDTIKDPCKKLFEEEHSQVPNEKAEPKDPFEMLEGAK